MPYIGNSDRHVALYCRERDLLLAGLNYSEVAKQTDERIRTISERNRLLHKIDIYKAFARRLSREGIPSRMPSNMITNAWFVGIVDGEGSFVVFTRPCTARPQYSEYRLALRIGVRDDDADMLAAIREHLAIGTISRHPARGNTRASVAWCCESIADVMEVLVPIFDAIPLRTKKRREYAIWRPLVLRRYTDTMGGYSNRLGVGEEYRSTFQQAIKAISRIRAYPT